MFVSVNMFASTHDNQSLDIYIFVSSKSIFEGLLFPLNKNLIQTYIKHFKEKDGKRKRIMGG